MRHGSPRRIKRDLDALIELHGSNGRESLLAKLMCDEEKSQITNPE